MKKLNLLLVVLLIVAFAAFALGSGETSNNDKGTDDVSTQIQPEDNAEETPEATVVPESSESDDQLGDYTLVIDSYRMTSDFEGKPVMIVKYIFTNVSNDNATSFSVAFEDAAYQNGVGLNESWLLEDSADYNMEDQNKEIKKGATIDVEVAYELNDLSSDVEIEVSELFSFDNTTLTKTFSISDGTDTENDITETEPVATEAPAPDSMIGDYSLVIDSCRMASDYEGKPVVIVKYIFTNVSDNDATSFSFAFEAAAFQGGVGLNESWFVEESADYNMEDQNKEIKKGATIEVEVAYELNDTTTDIEVEVSELFSFDDTTITKTFTIA